MKPNEKLPTANTAEQEHLKDTHETTSLPQETLKPNIETVPEEHNHTIDKLQESIHEVALSADELSVDQHSHGNAPDQPILGVQRELKRDAYTKTMRKVRSNLSPVERSFSNIIHHKALEPISEVGAKTIARPSAILGGGLTALIGSTVVLYLAKRYGFQYNLSIFFILLGAGFLVGLLTEWGLYLLKRKKA